MIEAAVILHVDPKITEKHSEIYLLFPGSIIPSAHINAHTRFMPALIKIVLNANFFPMHSVRMSLQAKTKGVRIIPKVKNDTPPIWSVFIVKMFINTEPKK